MQYRAARAIGLAAALVLGVVTFLEGGDVQAQGPANGPFDLLTRADLNRDGATTRVELRQFRTSTFGRLDVNRDRRLSAADVSRWQFVMGREGAQTQWRQFQATLDTDGNNVISRAEFISGPSPAFDAVDVNNDDVVSANELVTARAALAGGAAP